MLLQHFWSRPVAALRPPGATFSLLFRQGDGFHRNTFRKNTSVFVLRSYTCPRRWRHSRQGKRRLRRMLRKAVPAAPSVKCNVPPIPGGTSSWQPPLSFAAAALSPPSSPPFQSSSCLFRTLSPKPRRRLNRLLEAIDARRYACVYLRCVPWNLKLRFDPEFLFYLHGNAAPSSSSCPTLLRIISPPFMELHHATESDLEKAPLLTFRLYKSLIFFFSLLHFWIGYIRGCIEQYLF